MPYIRNASIHDVALMTPHLREGDAEEMYLATGDRPGYVLLKSYTVSNWVKVACTDVGYPSAMFGLRVSESVGVPWMICTDAFAQIIKPFRRQCRGVVEDMLKQCPFLTNLVLASNTTAHRWLRWCGFTIDTTPIPHGPFGAPFFKFTRTRHV